MDSDEYDQRIQSYIRAGSQFGNAVKIEVQTRAALAGDWSGRQPTFSTAESELTPEKRTHRRPNMDWEGNPRSAGEVRPDVSVGGHLTGYYYRWESQSVERASTERICFTTIDNMNYLMLSSVMLSS